MQENIFPRRAYCTIHFVGTGATLNSKNSICVLAPNALSEKIFAFLWFWMIFLAGLHIFHIFINLSLALHSRHLRRSFLISAVMDRRLKSVLKEGSGLEKKLKKMNFGQILFLYFFGRNVDYNVYRCVLEKLCENSPSLETNEKIDDNYHSQNTLRHRKKIPLDNIALQQFPVYPNVPSAQEDNEMSNYNEKRSDFQP